jgi:intein/homing endonuclease
MGGIGGAMNPSFCFVAGTTVLTTLGKKAIETIQVGDTIPCVDHITGEEAEKKVISTSVNKVDRLIELEIGDETLRCTETHPFQVKGRGWVNAAYLAPSDIVYTKDYNTATVKSVNLLELDEPVEVFNFEVEDCHTYFLYEHYILVHNGPCNSKFYKATRTDTGVQRGAEITRKQALQQIRAGKDVLTTSRSSAKSLVKDAFGNSKAYFDFHEQIPNAMKHFHDASNHFYHVFFT